MRHLLISCFLLATSAAPTRAEVDANWPRFRGPNGAGVGRAEGVAGEWSPANELWSTELPGPGHGSPVVWDDRLFLMAGQEAAETAGGEGNLQSVLLAFDASTGRELWRRGHPAGDYPMHASNTAASTTPAVDAQRVCVTWATADDYWVAAYTHDGRELWKTSIGPFVSSHGFACSPTLVGDVVCLTDDQLEQSAIIGLDANTGDELWRTPRPAGKAAYSSPCVVTIAGKPAVIAQSMAAGMAAYDVATGKQLWSLPDAFPARCVSSPVAVPFAANIDSPSYVVLGACGGGGSGKQLIGVRLDANGPSTNGPEKGPEEFLRLTKSVPYVPTPLVVGDMLILWHDRGTVACMDLATGDKLWEERVGGQFFSSPVSVGDAVIAVSNEGEVVSIAATREECRVLARNNLGAPTQATPAIAHGRLYLRTEARVLCIGAASTASLSNAENATTIQSRRKAK